MHRAQQLNVLVIGIAFVAFIAYVVYSNNGKDNNGKDNPVFLLRKMG
jgi:hypothetical protein